MQSKELKKSYMPVFFYLIQKAVLKVKKFVEDRQIARKAPCNWQIRARVHTNTGIYGRNHQLSMKNFTMKFLFLII